MYAEGDGDCREEKWVCGFISLLAFRRWLLMMCFSQEVVHGASEALKQQ